MADTNFNLNYQPIETPMVSVDYDFLSSALGRKQQQYDQGFEQVKSAYNSVLNAPISNIKNQNVRDEYLIQAKEKLKSLGKSDLSLSQNVSAATKVFSPIFDDKEILLDIAATKHIKSQYQQGMSALSSDDPDEKRSYNPASMELLQYDLMDLQRAERGTGQIGATPKRAYIPIPNILQDLAEYDKQYDFKGITQEHISEDGKYIVTEKNGVNAIIPLTARAAKFMQEKYDSYFNTLGELDARKSLEKFKLQNPNGSEKDFVASIKDQAIRQQTERLTGNLQTIYSTLDPQIKILTDLEKANGGKLSEHARNQLNDFLTTRTKLAGENDELLKRTSNPFTNANDKKDLVKAFMTLNKENAIANIGKLKAEEHSTTIKENNVYNWEMDKSVADNNLRLGYATLQANIDKNNKDYELGKEENEINKTKVIIDAADKGLTLDEKGKPITDFSQIPKYNATDEVFKTEIPDQLQSMLDKTQNIYVNNAFGSNGYINMLTDLKGSDGKSGVTASDIQITASAMQKAYLQGEETTYVPEENASYLKVRNTLASQIKALDPNSKYGNVNNYKHVSDLREALTYYVTDNITKKMNQGLILPGSREAQILTNAIESNKAVHEHLFLKNRINKATSELAAKDSKYKILINNNNQLVTPKDVAKEITNHVKNYSKFYTSSDQVKIEDGKIIYYDSDRNKKEVPLAQFATDIFKGESDKYKVNSSSDGASAMNGIIKQINNRYGTPEERKKLGADIGKEALGGLGDPNRNGTIPKRIPLTGNNSVGLIRDAIQPGNSVRITVDGKVLTPDQINSLKALSSDKDAMKIFGNSSYVAGSNSGLPLAEFTINRKGAADIKNVSGDFAEIIGKKIRVELSPTRTGAVVNKLPERESVNIYEFLRSEGRMLKSDGMVNAFGLRYEIVPVSKVADQPAKGCKVYYYDTNSGELVKESEFFDFDKNSPDEIVHVSNASLVNAAAIRHQGNLQKLKPKNDR